MEGRASMLIACKECGEQHRINVEFKDLLAWQQGQKIQIAMPYLDENQRELIMSQTCSKCWDKMFSPDSDELFI